MAATDNRNKSGEALRDHLAQYSAEGKWRGRSLSAVAGAGGNRVHHGGDQFVAVSETAEITRFCGKRTGNFWLFPRRQFFLTND